MTPIQGNLIWACPKPYGGHLPNPDKIRLEFPELIRFKGAWYCAFREGQIHSAHPSGKGRVIRSSDGEQWETAMLFEWDAGDVREPKLSITSEGMLMVNTLVNFVSKEPRADGYFYQLDKVTAPTTDVELETAKQSVTWLTPDGKNWSSVYACPTAVNTWRWAVTWYNGMGYGISYGGKDRDGVLYRTRDGKSWRVLKDKFFGAHEASENESSLAFLPEGTACCLSRCGSPRMRFGVGKAPYYQEWEWRTPRVDWDGDGNFKPAPEVFDVDFGGPKIIRLSDGRLVAGGRARGPKRPDGSWRKDPDDPEGKEDGRVMLFWVDPKNATLTRFLEVDGTSYPGIFEHEGMLWITSIVYWGDRAGVYLLKVKIPQ